MMDELQHECGIAAVYYFNPSQESELVTRLSEIKAKDDPKLQSHRLIPRMLRDLQNRGQLSAGMATYHPDREQRIEVFKEVGTVDQAFRTNNTAKFQSLMKEIEGQAAIGHVRYATCGPTTRSYAQPFERRHGRLHKWFTFGFNGNLANFEKLKQKLNKIGYHLTRDNDTEVVMHFLAHATRGEHAPQLTDVVKELAENFDGAYNLVYLNAAGDMFVLRDPSGLRPLCYATDQGLFAAASESVALQNLGFKNIRSLEPGRMIHVCPGKMEIIEFAKPRPTHCFFEWVYFANVASVLDDRSVYLCRSKLGEELAKQEREYNLFDYKDGNTIVVPVPDTGKAAADGMAYSLKIPCVEGLIRNRYVGRTFIESSDRVDKVRQKFTPLLPVLEGKRVILVEDSIVRSTTMANLLSFIKEQGRAEEVHVRVACPPIVAPCFYGIDMRTIDELFAPKHMAAGIPTLDEQKKMAKLLGADSLLYLPVDALARSLNLPAQNLCRACVTGEYPTPEGQLRYKQERVKYELLQIDVSRVNTVSPVTVV